jgi:hypothetical protein
MIFVVSDVSIKLYGSIIRIKEGVVSGKQYWLIIVVNCSEMFFGVSNVSVEVI